MTRENKLALVIGFGLLLLAGVLLSDHLSNDQRMEDDPLRAVEPRWVADPDILHVLPKSTESTRSETTSSNSSVVASAEQATTTGSRSTRQERPRPEPVTQRRSDQRIVMGERASRTGTTSTTSPRPQQATVRTHYVKKGDSLSGISKKFYGTTEHWKRIQSANNLTNPNQVRIGTRLVIPNLDAGGTSAVTTTKVASARPQTTTVREGENLSDIAKRELGNRNLWKLIWSANKASLPDPDVLRVGMTLQIPVVTARN